MWNITIMTLTPFFSDLRKTGFMVKFLIVLFVVCFCSQFIYKSWSTMFIKRVILCMVAKTIP